VTISIRNCSCNLEIPHFPLLFAEGPPSFQQHHNKLKPKENISIPRTSNSQKSQPISALCLADQKMQENAIYPSKNSFQLTTIKSLDIRKKPNKTKLKSSNFPLFSLLFSSNQQKGRTTATPTPT
jgi:hypothetical protein